MKITPYFLAGLLTAALPTTANADEAANPLRWSSLPPLPESRGVAGAFAGVSQDHLIVAGGANFPEGMPWDGGLKRFHDRVFVFNHRDQWKEVQRLPRPLAYGASVTRGDRVICIGGSDGNVHFAEVFSLHYERGNLVTTHLPNLPYPLAECAAALVGSRVLVVGGMQHPSARQGQREVLELNLRSPPGEQRWRTISNLPGPARIQPCLCVQNGELFVFGGTEISYDAEDTRRLRYLDDAFALKLSTSGEAAKWRQLAKMPRPNTASPSPGITLSSGKLVVLGGVAGPMEGVAPRDHPGFTSEGFVYDVAADSWSVVPELWPAPHSKESSAGEDAKELAPRVCAPMVRWHDSWIIVSGEVAPGRRTPGVLVARTRVVSFGAWNWSVLLAYLATMVGIGVWFSRRERATQDFTQAGGRIPW